MLLASAISITINWAAPWQWLASGNNATATGTVVVLFYTFVTYKMWKTGQDTLKASFKPVIVVKKLSEPFTFTIQNVGSGPAINLRAKFVHTDHHVVLSRATKIPRLTLVTPAYDAQGLPLEKGASHMISIPSYLHGGVLAIAVTCYDMTKTFHQSLNFLAGLAWEDTEIVNTLFGTAGTYRLLFRSLDPDDQRRMVYTHIFGINLAIYAIVYCRFVRAKFHRFRRREFVVLPQRRKSDSSARKTSRELRRRKAYLNSLN